jgi:acetylornithine deacetylase
VSSDSSIELLRDLVAIDSRNPSLVAGAPGERAIAEQLAAVLRGAGLDTEVVEAAPGRPNVIGVLEGRSPGRTLMYCGHIDTVGVDGMLEPFTPVIRDGRLYGRGSQDMKGGVAAMVDAARRLAANGRLERGKLVVACVVDEELASLGAEAVAREWRADAAVVTEPTDLQIGVAHKGFAFIDIDTCGVAAHGSRPEEGRDAIFRMGRLIGLLEELDRNLQAGDRHPLLGPASLHASTIHGGREPSIYPDRCHLQIERRTIPGEPGDRPLREVEGLLAALKRRDAEFEGYAVCTFSRAPYEIAPAAELPQQLAAACEAAGRHTAFVGMSFWTDAQILGAGGIPSVLFGPGGAGLHSVEEYVRIDDVLACRDILVDLPRRYC